VPQVPDPAPAPAPDPALVPALRALLQDEPDVGTALLFGSRAAGTDRPDSDVDLALLGTDDGADARLAEQVDRLQGRWSLRLGLTVQLVLLADVDPLLGHQAFRNGVKILERDPQRTARCLERILIAYFDGAYHRRLIREALDARLEARGRS
jgi:predicted nucleotidyltransferase